MYTARAERSDALAKDVAQKLNVDLFDNHRHRRFRDLVQNCLICAYQSECQRQLIDAKTLETPLPHRRNTVVFSNGD